jgi:cellobiose transport system permease protein
MSVLLPFVVAPVAVGLIFNVVFADNFGLVNGFLTDLGLSPIQWHKEPFWSHVAIATMVNYRWTGYNALILLAGMQAIPKDLYEAAAIDGAGQWRQFWRITLPMLTPTFLFVVVLSTIGGLQLFTEPLVFGNGNMRGGTQREFQTLAMYMYEKGINSLNTAGYGAAIAWALFLMIGIIAVINFALVRRTVK